MNRIIKRKKTNDKDRGLWIKDCKGSRPLPLKRMWEEVLSIKISVGESLFHLNECGRDRSEVLYVDMGQVSFIVQCPYDVLWNHLYLLVAIFMDKEHFIFVDI